MSVQAIVARIHVRPLEGSDHIQLGTCAGHQVIVSKETQDKSLGVFIPSDAQLSEQMAYENNLYREGKGVNRDRSANGYLEESRRVRCLKLRGAISEGIFLPLDSVAWTGFDLSKLTEGFTFNELNSKKIADKYMTAATLKAQARGQQGKAKVSKCPGFHEHFDTQQLRYFVNTIPVGASLIFTEKLHGTSGRTGRHLVQLPLPKWKQTWNSAVLKTIGPVRGAHLLFKPAEEWQVISGTRHTVLTPGKDDGYHKGNFRTEIHETMTPRKGETIYYEIVGYEGTERPIMASHSLVGDDPVRKALRKKHGNIMVYSYGCKPTEYKVYVYRITHCDADNKEHELSWHQIVKRCKELGLAHVPELGVETYTSGDPSKITEHATKLAAGVSTLDTHIREGVCVRVEHPDAYGKVMKLKSFEFSYLEGILRDASDYVDPEESS